MSDLWPLSQDVALLPFVFFSTAVPELKCGLEDALTPVSGSPRGRKDGKIANFEMWDEYGCCFRVGILVILSLLDTERENKVKHSNDRDGARKKPDQKTQKKSQNALTQHLHLLALVCWENEKLLLPSCINVKNIRLSNTIYMVFSPHGWSSRRAIRFFQGISLQCVCWNNNLEVNCWGLNVQPSLTFPEECFLYSPREMGFFTATELKRGVPGLC